MSDPSTPSEGAVDASSAEETESPQRPREDDGLRRLHPFSPLFQIVAQLRNLIAPLVFLVVSPAAWGVILGFVVLVGVVAPVARYLAYRYRFDERELWIRDGILQRNERRVPYDRIQNLDLSQGPLHRLLDVAEVRLETASGQGAEATLRVLSLDAVEELRRVLREEGSALEGGAEDAGEATAAGEPPLLQLSLGELVRLGLVANRGMVVVAAVLGFLLQQDELLGRGVEWGEEWLPQVDWQWSPVQTGIAAVLGALVVLLLLYLLSIALAVYRFHGFTLWRKGDYLRSELGLITRTAATTPRRRIQRLRVRASWLQRAIGRTTIRVDTAGGGGEEGSERGSASAKQWLAPIVALDRVPGLIAAALPEVEPEPREWQPISARAPRRLFRRSLVLLLAVSGALAFLSPWLLLLLLATPLLWLRARRLAASIGWTLDDHSLHLRRGWLGREHVVVRLSKIQSVLLHRSPFDRRVGMATLRIDSAGSGGDFGITLPYLDEAVARRLAGRLYREAAERVFLWG